MLYLVRHGQTQYNAERRIQGQLDTPLSDEGRRQAELLAERLKAEGPFVTKLYCSELRRAGETARIVGRRLGLTPVSIEGIQEINFGMFQGHTFEESARLYPEQYADFLIHGCYSGAHGGETGPQVLERARCALLKLPESRGGRALVICHGAVIGYLSAAVQGVPLSDSRQFIPDNTGVVPFDEAAMEKLRQYDGGQGI